MTYIGTDNYQGGVVGGEFINEKYPDGAKICILSGTVGNPAGDARIDGFVEAIDACITVLEGGTVEHEINTDVKVLPEQ